MTTVIIAIVIVVILIAITNKGKEDHSYKAEFGSASDSLSRFNHGFAATGLKALTRATSHENTALFGPTGSGKSSTVIISSAISLARAKSSMVFNDVDGSLWKYVSGYLAKEGYNIVRFDPSDPKHSESYNPLLHCKSISDIQKLALLVIRNSIGESKSDPFGENSAMMLLSLMARYLIFHAEPKYRTMQNTLRMIEQFAIDGKEQKIDKLFIQTEDEELIATYKATLVMGDKTMQSVISTLRTALSLWIDKAVCQTTAVNTIDLDQLRKKPTAIFLSTPLKDLNYYKPISALFIQTLFNHTLSRIPDSKERSIFFLLDEFATFTFPAIGVTISNIRKFSAGISICMQDEMSLHKYGVATAHQIKTNCGTQIYLKGQPLATCKELSQILGRYTYVKEDTAAERVRELMTPDEIRRSEKAIILVNNQLPLHCKMTPHFDNFWISRHTKLEPHQPNAKPVIEPPLIPFE